MCIVHFFKTLFKNNKSSNNNEDVFDWEAYEMKKPLLTIHNIRFLNVKNC